MDLYVSVSRVDEFKRVAQTDWASEELFIKSIRERGPLGWQAQWGTALHACIQDPGRWRQADGSYLYVPHGHDGVEHAITWPATVVDPCVAAWPKGCIFEKRAEKDYVIDGQRVTVSGRTDSVHGLVIVEGKTKFGHVDPTEFADSLQWRFYLDMMPWAACVEYRLHEIGGLYSDKESGELRIAKGGPKLEEIHVFRMWQQPGLSEPLHRWLGDFVAWAKNRGLTDLLKRWERAA